MHEGEVALITGCSTGIGRALCEALGAMGYAVVATARDPASLDGLEAPMRERLDVADPGSARRVVGEVKRRFGRLDVLVNNAGYSIRGALELLPMEDIRRMLDVNVAGIVNMAAAAAPLMRARRSGKIVNIGSISGRFSQPLNGIYCASKHAVEALSDTMRIELMPLGIQATVIEPGPIRSGFQATADANRFEQPPELGGCYDPLYAADAAVRRRQRYAGADLAAERIARIISSPKLRQRYEVAVPFGSRLLARMGARRRELLLAKFYGVA
jgi:NAD(P)-dependent dehydrogenase (short-subunit alcohol dehydrogenase family)